jgi:hypothetical protein
MFLRRIGGKDSSTSSADNHRHRLRQFFFRRRMTLRHGETPMERYRYRLPEIVTAGARMAALRRPPARPLSRCIARSHIARTRNTGRIFVQEPRCLNR